MPRNEVIRSYGQLIGVSLVIVYPMTDHYARCIKYECFNNERAPHYLTNVHEIYLENKRD